MDSCRASVNLAIDVSKHVRDGLSPVKAGGRGDLAFILIKLANQGEGLLGAQITGVNDGAERQIQRCICFSDKPD